MSIYTLVEINECGVQCREDFPAPDDLTAVVRAMDAAEGENVIVLYGERQVFPVIPIVTGQRELALV